MKIIFLTFLLLLFLTPLTFAQQLEWAITYGGSAPTAGTSISLDSSNNVMVAGYFASSVDFNPGAGVNSITSQGMNDGYLQRVNAQTGFYTGTTTVGGTLQERTVDAVPDQNGNLYSVGHFMGTVDLDPLAGVYSVTSAGGYDGFLVKTNDISQLLWAKTFSSPGLCNMSNVLVDQNNDLYVSGFFYDSVDLDPGAGVDMHYSSGYEDFFILKLDPNGNFIWGRSYGGTLPDQPLTMALDQNNQLILGGYFQGTVNFNPLGTPINLTSGGGADFFIMKMDANGNTLWAKSGGASGSESIADVCVDDNDNVYCVGTYASPLVDFDPGPGTFNMPNGGSNDIFVLKLDPAGNFLDARNLSSANNETVKSIAFRNNSIYLAGSYSGTRSCE